MGNNFISSEQDKIEKYNTLLPQIKYLIEKECDLIANLANITAALKETFDFFWIGFYLVKNGELVLGPFQGPLACTRISYGKGVCGSAWKERRTILVPDVNLFPNHISCNSKSQSEIVVPIFKSEKVVAVLDIDSEQLNKFNEQDAFYLTRLCQTILPEKF